MAFSANPHINRRLFNAIFDAGIAGEMIGPDRQVAVLRKARNAHQGQLRRVIDRVLALDAEQRERFFEKVWREYGI